jgi:hypothetical protein
MWKIHCNYIDFFLSLHNVLYISGFETHTYNCIAFTNGIIVGEINLMLSFLQKV